VIEDSAIEREYISIILKKEGFEPIVAEDGEIGLKIACDNEIEVILLDIIMPGIDGYEVCRRLKSDNKTKDIPVIFITGSSDIDSLTAAFDAGGLDFIGKPVNKYNILARVKVHAENNRLIKSLKAEVEKRKLAENELIEANDQYTSQNEELMQIIEQLDEAKTLLEEKEKRIRELIKE